MNFSRNRRAGAALLAGATMAAAFSSAAVVRAVPPRPQAVSTTSPTRILDTREDIGGHPGKVVPGETLRLPVPQAAGATSVMLNVTATEADGPGWVKVWPCDTPEPGTSSVNFTPGRIAANAVVVKLGSGSVCIATYAPVHLVADVAGWFGGSTDFVGTAPNRIVDTRRTGDPLTAGVERRIQVTGTPNIPSDAAVVAVNLTVDAPPTDGWVVAYPCGNPTSSSTLNFNAGDIVAGLTVVGVAGGAICVRSYGTTSLVVDTYGYSSGTGQLKVQSPQRLLDTRDGATWPYGPAQSGSKVAVRVAATGQIPANAASALLTVTVADATGDGFVTTWPCDEPLPNASTINTWAGQLRSNLALVKLAADGTACLQVTSQFATPLSLVVDAVGWTTGGPNRPVLPVNPIPPTGGSPPPTQIGPTGPQGPPGCGLIAAAFCETFDRPAGVAGTRSGDLDPTLWGVSRTISSDGFMSAWLAPKGNTVSMSTPLASCSFGATPGTDVRICNGRLFEAVRNPDNTKTNLSIYPKQPLDFSAGQDIVFDASMDGHSIHSAWPEIWITDQPVPASNGDEEGYQAAARNAIGFQFTGCDGDASRESFSVAAVDVTSSYSTTAMPFTSDGCVATSAHATTSGPLNHVRIHLSPTAYTIYGTNPGSVAEVQLAHGSWTSTLPGNRGLVWWTDVHYNACKFADDMQCDHAFAIDNFGFSGPKTYRDYTYDVPDANTPTLAIDPETGGQVTAVALAYPIGGGLTVRTAPVGSVPNVPTSVAVLFNTIGYSGVVPDVSLNGGPWISTPAFTQTKNFIHSVEVVIPAGNVVGGPNTISFRSGADGTVANINLLLVGAAPVP